MTDNSIMPPADTSSGTGNQSIGDTGGGGAPLPFYEGFKTDALKTSPSIQKFKDPEDLAGAYVNLEKRFGIDPKLRIDLPADPKDTEGMRAVWQKLGAPEKADGYGFQLDDKASDADKAMVADFQKTAYELALPVEKAQGLMKWWQDKVTQAQEAQAADFKARAEQGTADLKREWGQAYEHRTREIGNLLNQYADPKLVEELGGDKLGNYPGVAKFLGKLLDRMAEPGVAGGASGEGAKGGPLTPAQAKAEATKIEANPGFRDRNHPQHKALVEERNRLLLAAESR